MARSPNVLFILADDLGWADIGYHGSQIRTPNIDRLMRSGIELDQHYVCPVCTPSRVSLLTGRYPGRFGRHATWPTNDPVLPVGYRTIASMFREAGYSTGLFGKWHLGSSPQFHPGRFGFDTCYGSLAGGVDPYTHLYKSGPFSRTWHRNGELIDEPGHATDLITAEASRWISQQAKPWFCYVPYTAVHQPVNAPEAWQDRYEGIFDERGSIRERSLKMYAAYTSHMDHCIGQLIETIKCAGRLDSTIIIFASDNGAPLDDPTHDISLYPGFHERRVSVGSNSPLRGGKTTLYEGGIRTPCVFYWQGRLAAGHLASPCYIGDWMPTFAEMLGAAGEPRCDGQSLWPLLTSGAGAPASRTIHFNMLHREFAARRGDWKLIHRLKASASPGVELFNIAQDPSEQHDIASQHADLVDELRGCIAANHRLDETELPPARPAVAPAQAADDDP